MAQTIATQSFGHVKEQQNRISSLKLVPEIKPMFLAHRDGQRVNLYLMNL